MRNNLSRFLFLFLSVFSSPGFAQNSIDSESEDGDYPIQVNDAFHPCITAQEYELIEKQCAKNIKLLGLVTEYQRSSVTTSLIWPLKPAATLHDCGYYYFSAGVDHNPASGSVIDYNCGTITYDGHGGTDLSIWPFNFYKMDNDLVEVVAAAPGTILYKSDGHFDRNCTATTDTANYIVIRHADGSQANYWHMKKNSVTSKPVGQTVVAGEYLGVAGSSGSSSGPHLHFEVWSGSTSTTRVDPFAGSCNILNASSWWASQKPYNQTAVLKASVNTTDIVFPLCPATETSNESSLFQIPFQGAGLSPGYAKFYIFMTNDTIGVNVNLIILNPNGTVFNSWMYNNTFGNYMTSVTGFSKLLPTIPGTYTFSATYNGITCTSTFDVVNSTTGLSELVPKTEFMVYPNPANGKFTILLPEENTEISVTDMLGQEIIKARTTQKTMSLQLDENGVYIVYVTTKQGIATQKLIVSR